jgi:protoheme IX farnesyltransferase
MKSQAKSELLPLVNVKQRIQDYTDLMKPGITTLVMVTALAGFYLGSGASVNLSVLIFTLTGVGLVAGGGGALNHYLERDADKKMKRTKSRPLPAERLSSAEVLIFGLTISLAGMAVLFFFVNAITAVLGLISWISYVLIYTPMKRFTPFATLVGAIPGALPPMGGWTAAHGAITFEAFILFTILFMWQLPHFLAIAWICRDDYERGGFPMLTVLKNSRRLTGRQMIVYSAALLVVSLLPALIGLAGSVYFLGALLSGIAFFVINMLVAIDTNTLNARRVLWASIIHLPILLVLMMVDKIVL